jgi:hypothetical protein
MKKREPCIVAARMAASPNAPPPLPSPSYPAIEAMIEFATADEIAAVFAPITAAVAELKGPRTEQGKRALKAVEHTQALLWHLLQVREKLEAQRKGSR